eukprot:jgi/Hompol1/1874/HPOL_002784-RA
MDRVMTMPIPVDSFPLSISVILSYTDTADIPLNNGSNDSKPATLSLLLGSHTFNLFAFVIPADGAATSVPPAGIFAGQFASTHSFARKSQLQSAVIKITKRAE